MKKNEINLLDFQNVITFIYIISLCISIYITYCDKISIINNTTSNNGNLSIFNRTLVVALTICFLYISYENRKININKGKKEDLFNLQVIASFISLISTIIVLYVVIKSMGENYTVISGVSNPNL